MGAATQTHSCLLEASAPASMRIFCCLRAVVSEPHKIALNPTVIFTVHCSMTFQPSIQANGFISGHVQRWLAIQKPSLQQSLFFLCSCSLLTKFMAPCSKGGSFNAGSAVARLSQKFICVLACLQSCKCGFLKTASA